MIDDALAALPEKYRAPVVLCHLEGRSRAEAAGLLGWTEGTLSGRLARALDLLARRLSARGVTVPAAGVATALSAWAAPAAVPAALPTSTASAAALLAAGLGLPGPASGDVAALTRKVLRGMSLTRYKLASVLLACSAGVGLLTLAARSWAEPAPSAGRPATARADPPAAPPPKPAARPAAGGWSTRVTLAHDDPVAVVAVGTDLVAIGGEDGNLRLWDGKAGKDPAPLLKGGKAAGLTRSVDRLGFTPDGKYLYIITDGGKALARCEVTGKGRRTYGVRSDQERMIGVSADGETWLERSPGHPKSLLLRPNGWSRANGGRPFETIDFDADLALAVGSPDGKWFAAVTADGTIHVIEADGLKVARKIAVTDLAARAVAFSPDGRLLAVVGENGFARLFDAATGTEARGLDGLEGIVFAVGFSPDGRWVATGAQDGVARVWEARTGKPVAALKGHTDSVRSVAFGPDGKTLVTGSADKTVRVWGFEE